MTDDVLAGLDEIPWPTLTHAYGFADDVPELLRALRSESADVRKDTLYRLYGNIYHQGTRYPATAYAVPFLARLARDPMTPNRGDIVLLLTSLAIGDFYSPEGIDIAGWRDYLDRGYAIAQAEKLRELTEWCEAAKDEAERHRRHAQRAMYDPEYELECLRAELAAYDAVRAEVPTLRELLVDDDALVRATTAYLLSWFPEEAAGSIAALDALLERESDARVLAEAIIAAGILSATSLTPRLRNYLNGSEPVSRWAAAAALPHLGVVEPEVIAVLAAAIADPPPKPETGTMTDLLRDRSAEILANVDVEPDEIIDALLEGLSRTSGVGAFQAAEALLKVVFPDDASDPLPPFADLTDLQQRAVRALAELGSDTWSWLNFTAILREWNLPDKRAECRAYAGLDAPA